MSLITAKQRALMLANGERSAADPAHDPAPVVKLFTPDSNCTWLLAELDPLDPEIGFGLCDLGQGFPELGSVRLSELESIRGPLGLRVERDFYFFGKRPLSAYADEARHARRIVV